MKADDPIGEGPYLYEVRERVVFEYVWRVKASTKAEARETTKDHGDGEAMDQREASRAFLSVEKIG